MPLDQQAGNQQGRSQHFKEGGRGFQITKSCVVSDKYLSEVTLKTDTVRIEV